MTALLVLVGAAVGAPLRYLTDRAVQSRHDSLFPWGTFAVNLVGCLLFGAIAGAAEQRVRLAPEVRAFLLVGVLGGFTTFSSYAFESFTLVRDGQFAAATVNLVGQILAGLIGLWAGYVAAN